MGLYIQRAGRLGVFLLLCRMADAFAAPGDGIHVGAWVFSPYLDVSFDHSSNVYKDRTNEISDTFLEPELGLRLSSSAETNRFSMAGTFFYSKREYDTEDNRNFDTYGDSLTLRGGDGRRNRLELIQSYRHLDDNDRHASDFESSELAGEMVQDSNTLDLERDAYQFGGNLARRFTDKLELALSYRYAGVNYDNETHDRLDPKQLGVPEGLDLDGHIWQFDGSLGMTDKTDVFLTLRQGLQYQETIDDPAELTTARLGLKTAGSEKLVYNAGVGVERYHRPPEVDDEEIVSFNFSGSADWFITEKLTFRCGGYNGTQMSSFYEGNGMEYISGWAGMGYRWKPSTTFSVRGIYREDDYLDPVSYGGVTVDRLDQRLTGHARVDVVSKRSFLRVYLEATYDEVISNLDFVEYVDIRYSVGASVRY